MYFFMEKRAIYSIVIIYCVKPVLMNLFTKIELILVNIIYLECYLCKFLNEVVSVFYMLI